MEFIINYIDVSECVYKMFLEQTRVTRMTLLLHDRNDSELWLLWHDRLSENGHEN